jgi:hypothetical protein
MTPPHLMRGQSRGEAAYRDMSRERLTPRRRLATETAVLKIAIVEIGLRRLAREMPR